MSSQSSNNPIRPFPSKFIFTCHLNSNSDLQMLADLLKTHNEVTLTNSVVTTSVTNIPVKEVKGHGKLKATLIVQYPHIAPDPNVLLATMEMSMSALPYLDGIFGTLKQEGKSNESMSITTSNPYRSAIDGFHGGSMAGSLLIPMSVHHGESTTLSESKHPSEFESSSRSPLPLPPSLVSPVPLPGHSSNSTVPLMPLSSRISPAFSPPESQIAKVQTQLNEHKDQMWQMESKWQYLKDKIQLQTDIQVQTTKDIISIRSEIGELTKLTSEFMNQLKKGSFSLPTESQTSTSSTTSSSSSTKRNVDDTSNVSDKKKQKKK